VQEKTRVNREQEKGAYIAVPTRARINWEIVSQLSPGWKRGNTHQRVKPEERRHFCGFSVRDPDVRVGKICDGKGGKV
jgi:hypothetical protein